MEPNFLLDALMDEAGVSHAGLAARVNLLRDDGGKTTRYDHTSVGRWINGQRPRGRVPEFICDILSKQLDRPVSLSDIGLSSQGAEQITSLTDFVVRAAALWRRDQHRAKASDTPVITGMRAIAPIWEWENPPEDPDVSRSHGYHVKPSDIAVLQAARTRYEAMYRQVGGVATRARVVNFLNDHTTPLLHGSYSDPTGRSLFRATGGLAAVAGICAYDSDAQGLAQRYFHQAIRMAKASGDRAFGGYVIALLVNQALFLKCYRQAIAFAEAGIRTAGPHISPALKTDLFVMQAKAYAAMRATSEAHRCIMLAEKAANNIRLEDEPPETGYMQPGLVQAQLAEALTSLGELAPAREYAAEAVRAPAHARGRIHRMATLITVDINQGEVEQAATTTTHMVELATGMESHRLRDRFEQLRDRLVGTGNEAAKDAAARINQVLSVPL